MIKHLRTAFFLFCLSFIILLWGGYKNVNRILSMSRGNYFFEKTKASSALAYFRLNFPNNTTITLEKKENFWRIREADGYYADFAKINSFMKLIFQATVYRADYIDPEKLFFSVHDSLGIVSVDDQNQVLDTALIAPKNESNKFYYATLNGNNLLYQINGLFDISPFFSDWIQSPLLAIPDKDIKSIHTDKFHAYRSYPSDTIKLSETAQDVPQLQNLMNSLWYLSAIDVKRADHFNLQDYSLQKAYKITTFSGIIYDLNLFYNADEYWLSIALSSANLITNHAQHFLNENRMLYDGWYFRLAPNIGKTLANFSL